MVFFEKPVTLKDMDGTGFWMKIYRSGDEDQMHMIELSDENNIRFIYRLRLNQKTLDKIKRERKLKCDNHTLIDFIQDFISNLNPNTKWLQCNLIDQGCLLQFYEIQKLGEVCVMELTLFSLSSEEFQNWIVLCCEKYKQRWMDGKTVNEKQNNKLQDCEKNIRKLKDELEKAGQQYKKQKEELENANYGYQRSLKDIDCLNREVIQLRNLVQELQEQNEDIKKQFEQADSEADQLLDMKNKAVAEVEALKEDLEDAENEIKNVKKALNVIADKGRKYEDTIVEQKKELEKLRKVNGELEKRVKKFKEKNAQLEETVAEKDIVIENLEKGNETLNIQLELATKRLEELNRKTPTPPPTENLLPKTAATRRPCNNINLQLFKKR